MFYKILADIVVFFHLLWILFLIFGAFWGIKNKVIKVIHISALAFAVIIQVSGWYCPLTHLEIWLRNKHDPTLSYAGSFIVHYIEKIVYINLPRDLIIMLTIFFAGFIIFLYSHKRK